MIYLSGHGTGGERFGIGRMLAPTRENKPEVGQVWAADNGCFATPKRYSDAWYLAWLERLRPWQGSCLFATAPDVVGDAVATLAKSGPVFARIRALGYAPALVAQDGLEELPVPWEEFDCLFVGGTTEWKLSSHAAGLAGEAKARRKWVHMGRVNSLTRLRIAKRMGCDSCDGTYVAYGPDKLGRTMGRWVGMVRDQMVLDLGTA